MLPCKRDSVSLLPLRRCDLGPQLSLCHRHRSVNSPSSHPCENLPPGGEPTCSGPLRPGVQAWPLGLPGTRFAGKNHCCTCRPETPEAAVMLMHESRTRHVGAIPTSCRSPRGTAPWRGGGPGEGWRRERRSNTQQHRPQATMPLEAGAPSRSLLTQQSDRVGTKNTHGYWR